MTCKVKIISKPLFMWYSKCFWDFLTNSFFLIFTTWIQYMRKSMDLLVVKYFVRSKNFRFDMFPFNISDTVGEGNGQHTSFWSKVLPIALTVARCHHFSPISAYFSINLTQKCCPLPSLLLIASVAHCPHIRYYTSDNSCLDLLFS